MSNKTLTFKNTLYNIIDNGVIGNGWKYVEVLNKKHEFSLPQCLYYKGESMKNLLTYSEYINHLDVGKDFMNDFVKDIFRECYPGSKNPICKVKENLMIGGAAIRLEYLKTIVDMRKDDEYKDKTSDLDAIKNFIIKKLEENNDNYYYWKKDSININATGLKVKFANSLINQVTINPDLKFSDINVPAGINNYTQQKRARGGKVKLSIIKHIQKEEDFDDIKNYIIKTLLSDTSEPVEGKEEGKEEPEAIEGKEEPEAIEGKEEPEAIEGKEEPEAIEGKEEPEAIEGKEEPEAIEGKEEPEAIEGKEEPEAIEGKEEPEAIEGKEEPEAMEENDENEPEIPNRDDPILSKFMGDNKYIVEKNESNISEVGNYLYFEHDLLEKPGNLIVLKKGGNLEENPEFKLYLKKDEKYFKVTYELEGDVKETYNLNEISSSDGKINRLAKLIVRDVIGSKNELDNYESLKTLVEKFNKDEKNKNKTLFRKENENAPPAPESGGDKLNNEQVPQENIVESENNESESSVEVESNETENNVEVENNETENKETDQKSEE
jgi:hypothetical protein